MQTGGSGAPDPQKTQPAPPYAQPRMQGQPLGVYDPAAAGQNPPPAGGPPVGPYSPTVSYQPPVLGDPPTEPNTAPPPGPPPAWPGLASPFASTVQRPPIYLPPGAQLPAPPVPQAGLVPIAPALPVAPPAPPAHRQIARTAPVQSRQVARPRAASAPARAVAAASQPAPRAQQGRWTRWLPLPHLLLALSLGLMLAATRLPWGVDANGNLIMLQTTSVPGLASQGDAGTALQVAYDLIAGVGVLSAGAFAFNVFLRGINRLLGGGCMAGCLLVPLYPILLAVLVALLGADVLAASFGGAGPLAQAPGAQTYGLGGLSVVNYKLGYLAWYTGIMLNIAGLLGEFAVSGRGRR